MKNPNEFFRFDRRKKNIKDTIGPLSNEIGALTHANQEMASI